MELFSYDKKICVVTGASSGIGLSTIKMLLQDGAIVYSLDLKKIKLDGVISLYCDLKDKDSIDHAFLEIPDDIDYFFGIGQVSGCDHDYYSTFMINFISYKYICDRYLKTRMSPGSSICFMSSMAGDHYEDYYNEYKNFILANTWEDEIKTLKRFIQNDSNGFTAFALSCRAINYYTKLLSTSYGQDGIRVNAIMPAIQNDLSQVEPFLLQTGNSSRRYYPYEISKVFLFLNSDMASYISGQCIPIDYGESALLLLGKKHDYFQMKTKSKLFHLNSLDPHTPKEKEEEII